MSNTKTKMKTGTIAVIALSIVLVLSLVTTITLAYFTASRNVITTIQFANGVRLQMGGAYRTTAEASPGTASVGDEDTPPSIGPETLYWKAAYGAKTGAQGSSAVPTGSNGQLDETTGTYTEISEKLFFEDLKVRVLDLDAYVAVRVAVTGKDSSNNVIDMTAANVATTLGGSYVAPEMENVWMPYNLSTTTSSNTYGWFVYRGSSGSDAVKVTAPTGNNINENPAHADRTAAAGFVDIIDDWTIEADNNLAGKTLVFAITVYASNTLDGLAAQIDSFNNVATTGPVAADASNKVGYATSTYVAPSNP